MNALEGGYYISYFIGDTDPDQFMPNREEMRRDLLPMALNLVYNRTFPDSLIQLVEGEYTNWSDPNNYHSIRVQYAKIFGDTGFAVPTVEFARLHLTSPPTAKTYVYKFMPRPSKRTSGTPIWLPLANHADDLGFVFGFRNQPNAETWEIELSKHMMRYWTNFAKTGDPNKPTNEGPVWHEYNLKNQHYLELDKSLSSDAEKQYVFGRETHFWLDIFPSIVSSTDDRSNQEQKICYTSDGRTLTRSVEALFTIILSFALFFAL